MNRQQTQQLIEIINKLISKEVNRQMISMKTQILSELKRSPQYQQAPRQSSSNKPDIQYQDVKSRPHDRGKRPNIQYTSNPILNELLQTTAPFEPEQKSVLDSYGKMVNYVTEDVDGRPVDLNNPAVLSVLEAMNRNYSDVIEPINEAPKKPAAAPMQYQPIRQAPSAPVGNFKNAAIASMMSSDFDEDIQVPDAFSEKDW